MTEEKHIPKQRSEPGVYIIACSCGFLIQVPKKTIPVGSTEKPPLKILTECFNLHKERVS